MNTLESNGGKKPNILMSGKNLKSFGAERSLSVHNSKSEVSKLVILLARADDKQSCV